LVLRTHSICVLANIVLAIFTIGEGVATNFAGLKAMRFFVGVFEAGLIPGEKSPIAIVRRELTLFRKRLRSGTILPTVRTSMEIEYAHGW
jgi:hypothetical protein